MTEILNEVLWYEKYRPTKLPDVALEDANREVLHSYITNGEIPHLLFIGPAGSGKTTVARILYRSLDAKHLTLNASKDRGIDVVRGTIARFVTGVTGARWNIVFLDEADAMTSDAQTAMRNLIEAHADRARFILTANFGSRIIGPIQSRCQTIIFGRPPLKERYRILANVLKKEEIAADPPTILSYAEHFPDMRQMLMCAQKAYLGANGKLPPATKGIGTTGADLLKLIETKNWTSLRNLTKSGEFDPSQALRELFHAVPDEHKAVGRLRLIVGKGVHESGFTPDAVILFLAVCAEAMEAL